MILCSKSTRYLLIILPKTEHPLNTLVSLPMAFAAKVHRAEGQFEHLKSALNIKYSTFNMTFSILTSLM